MQNMMCVYAMTSYVQVPGLSLGNVLQRGGWLLHKSAPHVSLNKAVIAHNCWCGIDMITPGRVLVCQHVGF